MKASDIQPNPCDRVPLVVVTGTTSRIGFGTGGLLRIGSARRRQSVLAAALASGITHFDTAPIYGLGESERSLGRFLAGHRHGVTVTTKFGLRPSALAARLASLQRVGRRALRAFPVLRRAAMQYSGALYTSPCFAPDAVRACLEASLRALRTDHIDLYLAHQAAPEAMPEEELIDRLEELRRAGKIRAYGVATDLEKLSAVLERRPRLARVVQYDRDPTDGRAPTLPPSAARLIITYGSLGRAIARCRARGAAAEHSRDLELADQDALGSLLLRAAVLSNPLGIVLMQSRSVARIERNVQAANSSAADERVEALLRLFKADPDRDGHSMARAQAERAHG